MVERSNKTDSIFWSALGISVPEERDRYLNQQCADDPKLRAQVDELLAAYPKVERFLETPAFANDVTGIPVPPVAEKSGAAVGPYKLLEQIGEGGFGVVFLAEQERPVKRRIALKVIKPGMDTREVIARFEVERQALAMMDHPNIAKVYDAGATENGRPYFVMELVQGVPITEYCEHCNRTTRERLELFINVCLAVQHAHQKGIIHRDIKPTNVLVAMQDGRPAPKIIDFGVAKAINQQLTEHTLMTAFAQMVGTPLYMSPEQAELSPLGVDTRSDIYSMGALLYELLTGTTPFDKDRLHAASYDELRRIIREEEPPRPSARISTLAADMASTVAGHRRTDSQRLRQTIRGDLDWILMKSLDKDRNRRYDSAGSLARDIERYLHHEPVQACPPSTAYRVKKFMRRYSVGVMVGAAIAGALIGGLILASIGFLHARTQTRIAEAEAAKATAISELFQSALQSANPDEAKVGGYTVRELLQDISTGLSGQFADQPEVEIELRRTIGLAFRNLGSAAQADPHFKTALALARKVYGPDHNKVAEILVGYGPTAGDQGRYKEAEEAYCDAARIYRLNGTTGRPLVIALWRYEVFLAGSGRDIEAVTIAQEALDLARASGTEFPEVPSILHKLAEVKIRQNEYAEAEKLAQHAVEVHRRLNGTEGLQTAWGGISLGMALDANGKYVQAEAAYREALTIFRLHYDSSHRSIGMALDGIKRALLAQNNTAALEALQREQQEWTAVAMNRRDINSLISEIRAAPSFSPAVAQAEQAATIAKYASRRQKEEIGAAILQHARETFHNWNRDFPSAQRLTQLALGVYRSLARAYPNEPNLLGQTDSLCLLGDIEMELGKLEECEQTAREAQTTIDDAIKSFPHNRDLRKNQAESHRLLGNALREKGATDEALQQCRQAVEIASQLNQEVTDTSAFTERLTFSKLSLADALLRADQFSQAATEYRSLLTFNESAAIRFPKETWTGELASNCIRRLATTLPAHAKGHPEEAAEAFHLFEFALRQLKQFNARTAQDHPAVQSCLAKGYLYAIPLLAAEPEWAVELEQAEQDFQGLLADFPKSDGGRASVGWASIFLVRSFSFEPRNLPHLERAIQEADRVFDLHSDDKAFDANIWCQFASEHVQLGDLYVQVGRADKAEDAFRKAVALCDEHAQSNSMGRAQLYVALASFLAGAGRSTGSEVSDLYQKAMELARGNANVCNALAWMLATSPATNQQNANKNRAIEFAQQAVKLSPKDGSNWNTLGVAQYRSGDWPSAVKALEKSIDLRGGGDAFDWFFLAMAHWQLGQKDEARKWYDQAVEWTNKNLPKNEELQRFRAEAAELLRVTQPQPATEVTRPI